MCSLHGANGRPRSPVGAVPSPSERVRSTRSLTGRHVPVAEAAHRLDRLEAFRLLPELLAQVRDVELHLVARDAAGVAPDPLDQLIGREDVARMLDEADEQP